MRIIARTLLLLAFLAPLTQAAEKKENAEASKLLAEARAARAEWAGFTGFSADVEVNIEGTIHKGKVDVDHKGKVIVSGIGDTTVENQLKRQLSSIVGHRLADGGDQNTPCAYADEQKHHPLGRAIEVLNDEFHSSYRIRDRQVIVVNRAMKDARFTITVLENKLNEEKQFLPAHYVVNYWDAKSNALKRSESFRHEWVRVGKFDLPSTSLVVAATPDGKLEARELKLTNHKLK